MYLFKKNIVSMQFQYKREKNNKKNWLVIYCVLNTSQWKCMGGGVYGKRIKGVG